MEVNLKNYSEILIPRDGIYFSQRDSQVSYPKKGNSICFQIEDASFWFRHRNQCITSVVNQFHPGKIIFDIGGGNGFVSKELQQTGMKPVLLEPGIDGCKNARLRGVETVVCATMESAGIHSESIPAVGLFDVVEHIENDVKFLEQIHSMLLPSGYLFLTVPSFQSLWSDEDIQAGHFRRYTTKGINATLKSIGFEINYSTYFFLPLVIPIFILRTIPFRFGFASKEEIDINSVSRDHSMSKFLNKIMQTYWEFEANRLFKGKKNIMGSSLMIVAKKK